MNEGYQQKKICYLIDTLNTHSGWGRLANEIISRVSQDPRFKVIVLSKEKSGNHPNEFAVLEDGFWGMIRSVLRSRRFIKESDIIHSFDGWPNAVIMHVAGLFLPKRFFITAVGTYSVLPLGQFLKGFLLRLALRKAEAILAISNHTKKEILKRVNLENIKTVNPGVDFKKFYGSFRDPLAKQNILLSVGAIKPRKGYHTALEVFFRLKKKFPDLKYIIIGEGNDEESSYFRLLRRMIEKSGVAKDVLFPGDISEEKLAKIYEIAKVFLLPSVEVSGAFEGFGLVILEANSAGIPAVGTTPSGMDDIIVDGKNGFLVSPDNEDELEKAIEKLLLDDVLYKRMSKEALEIAQKMSWEKTVEEYKMIYG